MSWSIDKTTSAVTMHKGDTGAYWVQMNRKSGNPFVAGDVAIYEVWQGNTMKIHREYDLQPEEPTAIELGDGKFLIAFRNSDTDTWAAGQYNTEIRVSLNPIRSDGSVVDGDTVRTVVKSTITISNVLIDI